MTGLWAFETAVVVSRNSTTVFHNNTGIDVGGGLIMIDDSYLVFEDHSIINFTQNSAEKGGAIYVEITDCQSLLVFIKSPITCIQNHQRYISLTTRHL